MQEKPVAALEEYLIRRTAVKLPGIREDRYQPEPVREHFILYHRSVVQHKDLLYRHRGHLCDENAAKRVGDGAIDSYEIEDDVLLIQLVHLHLEVTLEPLQREAVVKVMRSVRAGVLDGGGVAGSVHAKGNLVALLLELFRQAIGMVGHVAHCC